MKQGEMKRGSWRGRRGSWRGRQPSGRCAVRAGLARVSTAPVLVHTRTGTNSVRPEAEGRRRRQLPVPVRSALGLAADDGGAAAAAGGAGAAARRPDG